MQRRGTFARVLAVALALVVMPALANAASQAGTVIRNVAQLSFVEGDRTITIQSNVVTLRVDELLDLSVETLTPVRLVEAAALGEALAFRVTNLGNAPRAFDLSQEIAGGDAQPGGCRIVVDADGDGVLNLARDGIAAATPVLSPRAGVVVWILCDIPASAPQGASAELRLQAYPPSAVSDPALGDVIFGPNLRSGATTATATYRVGKIEARLIKSQSVSDAAGAARAVAGAIVTYTLEAQFGDGPTVRQAEISDAVPAGSTYVPGSLVLDGAPLTDTADSDAGVAVDGRIVVALGDIAVPTRRVVAFKVRINALGNAS